MWKTISFLFVLLLIDEAVSARNLKRRDSYLSVPPAPVPQIPEHAAQHQQQQQHHHHQQHQQQQHHHQHTAPAAIPKREQSPYQYEDINPDEFPLSPPPLRPQTHRNLHGHRSDHSNYEDLQFSYQQAANAGSNFLIDNGLRSIAKGSADTALGAVASQNAAAKQAAYVAKSTLAQAAAQAASTAVAALKGKEVLLRRLEEQSVEAHKALENELAQLHQAKRAAKTAQHSAQQAINHVSVLTAALNNAQAASELAQRSASEAAAELASQIDMVAQAKSKLEQIESNLYSTRLDYEETKEAAEKATLSAQEAQINANDAGAHANVELSDTLAVAHNLHDKIDENETPTAADDQAKKRDSSIRNRNRRRSHKNNKNNNNN